MTPDTRPCVRCRVAINAASGYCTLCGAVQRRWRPGGRSLAALAALLGLAAVGALIAVLARAGRGSHPGQARAYRSAGLATLVPGGWVGGPAAGVPPGTTSLVFVDAQDDRRRLVVTAARPAAATALVRARAARRLATSDLGYRQHFFGHVLFADGRPAWLLTFDGNDSYHAVYIYSACLPTVAMTVEMRAPLRTDLAGLPKLVAAASLPRC
jgi:hypothetical protein